MPAESLDNRCRGDVLLGTVRDRLTKGTPMADMNESEELDTRAMIAIHTALRRELGIMPDLLAGANGADDTQVQTIAGHWTLVSSFLSGHHEGEDEVLWPRLRERLPESIELVDALEAEHVQLHALLDRGNEIVASWSDSEDVGDVEEVVDLTRDLAAILREHSAREESELLPLLSGVITIDEWDELPEHAQRSIAPDQMLLMLGMVLEDIPVPARAGMLATLPEPVRQAWESFGQDQYGAYVASVREIAAT